MPATYAHYCFAKTHMPSCHLGYEKYVFLGTQGPDPFFAYGSLPWRKKSDKKDVNLFCHDLHHQDISGLFYRMVQFVKTSPRKKEVKAYIDGVFMHYALDRFAHPYIFYRSGFDDEGKLSGKWHTSHSVFEASLDRLILKHTHIHVSPKGLMPIDDDSLREISHMWHEISVDKRCKENTFSESAKDHVASMNMIYNVTGLKRALLSLLGKDGAGYSMAMPRFLFRNKEQDIENKNRKAWVDPFTGEKKSLSIYDIFAKASELSSQFHELMESDSPVEEYKKLFDGIDHDGGKIGSTMKYKSGEIFR